MKVSDVCVYVCLCVYVFCFVLLYSCVRVCDFACTYVVHMYVCVDLYTCVCAFVYVCMCMRVQVCICAHTQYQTNCHKATMSCVRNICSAKQNCRKDNMVHSRELRENGWGREGWERGGGKESVREVVKVRESCTPIAHQQNHESTHTSPKFTRKSPKSTQENPKLTQKRPAFTQKNLNSLERAPIPACLM